MLSTGRTVAIGLLLTAPTAAVLAALLALGLLPPLPALLALLAAAAGVFAILVHPYRDLVALAAHLDRLAGEPAAAVQPPPLGSLIGRGFAPAVDRLQRSWAGREAALGRRLDDVAAVIEALHDPLLLLDRGRNVVRANGAAVALFGDRAVGADLAASLRHPDILRAADAVLAGGPAATLEWRQPVPVERVYEVRVQGFATAASGAPAVLLMLHDITALRRAEQMRADFVANASHELRTPLSTLVGFIETLRGPARDDAEARERFLAIMADQAGRMARLVADLLSLSRIELDEHTPPRDRVEIAPLLARVADMLQLRAAERGLRLALDIEPGLPAVLGDADQLMQVFQNLADNAVKYARAETEVTLAARRAELGRGPAVAVAVRDRGEGIERIHLPRLTERFYRVDAARSRALGGTGLGLAIVKHVVNRHRGRLTIDSELGQGSTFTVLLPAAAPASAQIMTRAEPTTTTP